MAQNDERMRILEMIDDGTISPQEGLRLLNVIDGITQSHVENTDQHDTRDLVHALSVETDTDNELNTGDGMSASDSPESEDRVSYSVDPSPEMLDDTQDEIPSEGYRRDEIAEDIRKWKQWWMIPMWVGIGITVIGGLFMFWAYQSSGVGFWFACSWVPFLVGLLVLTLAIGSNKSPWLHVRVQQAPGNYPKTIAISFPLPLRFITWLIQTFGNFIPGEKASQIADLIVSLGDSITPEQPFFVDVDEGEGGEKVQVFIG